MENFIILKQLKKISDEKRVSFHVPGHKNGKIYKDDKNKYFSESWLSLDMTEIPGTDNLFAAQEMIKDAQDEAAKFFGADETFFLINGTSTGNISALMTIANPNEKVIVPRDCHKSIMHGLILGGIIPVYVRPCISRENNIPMGINPMDIEKAIIENPDVKGVVITYPNYYGICSDIKEIVKIVHKYDKILIVDEAHGAHFNLSKRLPISSIQAGADIVIQSTHKTLLSLTQSSMLHVKSNRIDIDRLKLMLMMNQSSSPSYLLMASLDTARTMIQNEGKELMDRLLENIDWFCDNILSIKGINILNRSIIGKYGVEDIDQTRLVIDMTEMGLTGTMLDEKLRKEYNIQMEMSDLNNVVAVCTIGNSRDDFDKLLTSLMEIIEKEESSYQHIEIPIHLKEHPKIKMTPRDAVYKQKIEVTIEESVGKVSGEYIIPYPPGIPIICPGEEITNQIIAYVKELKKRNINMMGMNDPSLRTIKIIKSIYK